MSLIDSPREQRAKVKQARLVLRAAAALDLALASAPDGMTDLELDDLRAAQARVWNWLTEQPQWIRSAIRKEENA